MLITKEFKRAILNWRFAAPVVVSLVLMSWKFVLYYPLDPTPPGNPGDYPFYFNAYDAWRRAVDAFVLFAPLAAALPYAGSFLQERNQGFARYALLRMPHTRYFVTKFLVNGLVGGMVVVLPMLLFLGFTMSNYPRGLPPVPPVSNAQGPVWAGGFFSEYYKPYPDLYIAVRILLGFLFGVTFATLGMALSPFVRVRYILLAIPFLFLIAFGFIANFVGAPVWWSAYVLVPDGINDSNALTIFAPLGIIFLLSTLSIFVFIRKYNDAWLY